MTGSSVSFSKMTAPICTAIAVGAILYSGVTIGSELYAWWSGSKRSRELRSLQDNLEYARRAIDMADDINEQ